MLTGDAGVGKTALLELLARRLARGEVPRPLQGTKLIEISMNKVVAGTRYRGDFEERMEEILSAVAARPPSWIFIDEAHLIHGAGHADGIIGDASQILKPYLARGMPRVIGATTSQEYHRWITQDPALERRFEEILLSEPTPALTREMVRSQATALAEHHGVAIVDDVVDAAISLTDRHERHRHQPDKSVDLLDRVAVAVLRRDRDQITVSDLEQKLGLQTHEKSDLSHLAERLAAHVIGQDTAVDVVSNVLIQHSQRIGKTPKTLGNFLFAGQTGVGKTGQGERILRIRQGTAACGSVAL